MGRCLETPRRKLSPNLVIHTASLGNGPVWQRMGLAECWFRNVPEAGYLAAAALGLLLSPDPAPSTKSCSWTRVLSPACITGVWSQRGGRMWESGWAQAFCAFVSLFCDKSNRTKRGIWKWDGVHFPPKILNPNFLGWGWVRA